MKSRFSPKERIQVRTVSGRELGRVASVDIDNDTGRIVTFFVSGPGMLPRFLDHDLAIAWSQVVEWTGDVLTVSDAVVPVTASQIAMSAPSSVPPTQFAERA